MQPERDAEQSICTLYENDGSPRFSATDGSAGRRKTAACLFEKISCCFREPHQAPFPLALGCCWFTSSHQHPHDMAVECSFGLSLFEVLTPAEQFLLAHHTGCERFTLNHLQMTGKATQGVVCQIDGMQLHGDVGELLPRQKARELTADIAVGHQVLKVVAAQTSFQVYLWGIDRQRAPVGIKDDDPTSWLGDVETK